MSRFGTITVSHVVQTEVWLVHATCTNYSRTSDSGHSEKGTLYCKPLNKRHWSWSQITQFPIVFIQIKLPRRETTSLQGSKPCSLYWVPKCPLFRGSTVLTKINSCENTVAIIHVMLPHVFFSPSLSSPPPPQTLPNPPKPSLPLVSVCGHVFPSKDQSCF